MKKRTKISWLTPFMPFNPFGAHKLQLGGFKILTFVPKQLPSTIWQYFNKTFCDPLTFREEKNKKYHDFRHFWRFWPLWAPGIEPWGPPNHSSLQRISNSAFRSNICNLIFHLQKRKFCWNATQDYCYFSFIPRFSHFSRFLRFLPLAQNIAAPFEKWP